MKNLYQWITFFSIIFVFNTSTVYSQTEDEVYCNGRFNFCLQYPSDFFTEKEFSANNDGIELIADEERVVVKVSGSYNALKSTIEEEYELFKKYMIHDKPDFEIYALEKDTAHFVLYASNKREVYYQKTISIGSQMINLSISSTMPTLEESKMAIEHIEKDLMFLMLP